jgi:hypothetical protein
MFNYNASQEIINLITINILSFSIGSIWVIVCSFCLAVQLFETDSKTG